MRKSIIDELAEAREKLAALIIRSENRLKKAPPGSLNISLQNGHPRYYWNLKEENRRKKVYLGQEDDFRISTLAQKDFDRKIIKAAKEQKTCIDQFLRHYDEDAVKKVYSSLSDHRKGLIEAEIMDDREYAERWMSVEYEAGRFEPGMNEYYTIKGERVRSKSEKIIADTLYSHGIPYRYEYPLHLGGGQIWRPDFTLLDVQIRKEYILEHLGMMDDTDYLNSALGKIQLYIENGYFPGENLLLTAESSVRPLSTKSLELMIKHYFPG